MLLRLKTEIRMSNQEGKILAGVAFARLVDLFEFGQQIHLPPAFGVCGRWHRSRADAYARIERRRQEKLADCGKNDKEIGEEVYSILKQFPFLAGRRYRNCVGIEIYPRKFL